MLRAFAWIIAERIRRSDTICRWQDQKFVVLLPVTRYSEAAQLVETLRPALSPTQIGAKASVKASFGIAEHDPGADALTTLEDAERAMSEAAQPTTNGMNGSAAAATSG
jgi:diguanylate cyclase (GGDEF)-like protein